MTRHGWALSGAGVLAAAVLAGCGQTGPLVLPRPPARPADLPADARDTPPPRGPAGESARDKAGAKPDRNVSRDTPR